MSTPHPARLPAALLVLALLAGCGGATVEVQSERGTGATLEVVNRTEEAMVVAVRGREEGIVPSESRARFRWLRAGEATVTARPRYEEPDGEGPPIADRVTLADGETTPFVLPGPRPTPPPLSTLEVGNALPDAVVVHLDDERLGRVLAGDQRTFRDVPSGSRTVVAVEPDTGLRLEEEIALPEDGLLSWTAETALGTLTVFNEGDEPVQLYLDGRARDRIAPGERAVFERIPAGPHELVAHGLRSDLERHHRITLDADVPHEWHLETERAAVTVVNATGEPLEVTLPTSAEAGGGVVLTLAPGEEHTLEDRPAGEMILEARGEETGLPYDDRIRLVAGRHLEWVIRPARVAVRVENHTSHTLVVRAEGYRRGRVRPGGHLLVGDLPPKPVQVVATSEEGSSVHRRIVEPGRDRAAVWRIETATSAVQVVNERREAVTVFADSRRLGIVPAQSTVTLTGLEVGERLLEAVGDRGQRVGRSRRAILEGEATRWVLEDPRGTLVLTNDSGEPLKVQGRLASQQARVAPDQRVLYHLKAGRARLRVVGQESALPYTRTVDIPRGGVIEWEIRPARGALEVINALDEAIHLELDDRAHGRVAPGGRRVIDGLPPGAHRLRAKGETSRRVRTVKRMVPPEGIARWRVSPRPARLMVFNDTVEPIYVYLDDRPYGRVEAEARKGFGALPRGRRSLDAVGIRTGWTYTVDLELQDGGTSTVHVPSPTAVLVVDNQSGEAQRVEVDGEEYGEIPEGGLDEAIPIPTGERRVFFEGARTGRAWSVSLQVRPSQTIPLTVPPSTARLVVVNRTERALRVRLDDEDLGLLAAGESLVREDVEPDTHRLEARAPDGTVTHRERRVIRRGRTDTWVLAAPPAGE
ncbi:MAG: hypothetical protein ACQEXJ_11035 [Myxococcota bacterium]